MESSSVDAFVHRFEPGAPGERRALLLLHGTGGDEHDLLPLGRMLLPQATLLSPRGQVLEHGMPRFFRRIAEGVFDVEDLRMRTQGLANWLAAAQAAHGLTDCRWIAAGFSNGANIAASLLLLRPESLAGAILFRATLPFEPETVPSLGGIQVLIASGRDDPLVRPADVERLASRLRQGGADVDLEWSAGGHTLAPSEVTRAREWLEARSWS